MDLRVKDKTVLITGSSNGLGKAIAIEYAKEGANVVISSRNEENLKDAKKDIIALTANEHVHYVVCDTADDHSLINLVDETVNQFGSLDIVVNSTGGPPAGSLFDIEDETWMQAINQLLLSVIRLTKYALPHMEKQGAGRFVNITSTSIKAPLPHLMISNTLRPAIWGFTKDMAREYAEQNIFFNTVGPGSIATDRVAHLNKVNAEKQAIPYETFVEQRKSKIPIKRFAEPDEFARSVLFFGSFANSYITGQALLVDGGATQAL